MILLIFLIENPAYSMLTVCIASIIMAGRS
jgi:hypothetical protein